MELRVSRILLSQNYRTINKYTPTCQPAGVSMPQLPIYVTNVSTHRLDYRLKGEMQAFSEGQGGGLPMRLVNVQNHWIQESSHSG